MPNLGLLALAVIVPLIIICRSAKKDKVQTRAYLNSFPADQRPVHAWVSGEAHPLAYVLAVLVCVACCLLSCVGMF